MSEGHGIEVAVDRALCIGNGVCVAIAPCAFTLDADMKAAVVDPEAEAEANLLAAAEECPTQAIYLSAGGKPLYP
ncbi:MAG TPA: ferredoxin [Chloroflexota bacterium]|nr:ferredoxin [Chloroflexota bacterium]